MVEATFELDRAALMEVRWKLLAPVRRKIVPSMIGVGLLLAGIMLADRAYGSMALLLAVSLMLTIEVIWLPRHSVKVQMRRIQEMCGTASMRETIRLEADHVAMHNHSTQAQVQFPYPTLVRFEETVHYYVLVTHGKQAIIVSKDALGAAGCAAFVRTLRQMPTRIQWKKKYREMA